MARSAESEPVYVIISPVYSLSAISDGDGLTALDPPGGIYLSNTLVTVSARPREGSAFLGWEGEAQNTPNPITRDEHQQIYCRDIWKGVVADLNVGPEASFREVFRAGL